MKNLKKIEVLEDLFLLMQKHGVFKQSEDGGECSIVDESKNVLFGLKTLCGENAIKKLAEHKNAKQN